MAKHSAKRKKTNSGFYKKKKNTGLVCDVTTHNHITPSGRRLRKEAWLAKQQLELQENKIQEKWEAITTVSEETLKIRTKETERQLLQNKIENYENLSESLGMNELVNLFDSELIELTKVHCSKTGVFLFEYSNQMIQESVKLLGIEKTKEFLKLKRKTERHYHPITVYNNSDNLRELNEKNPVMYWIIAANKFFNESPENLIQVHKKLDTNKINLASLVYCNELLRRYLGLSNANNLKTFSRGGDLFKLLDVVSDQETFNLFTNHLKTEIYKLIQRHCKNKRARILQEQQLYIIDLAMIKNVLGGDSSYFHQKKLKNATQEETIKFDMMEIFDDELIADMRKMDNRREHLDQNPPIPLHIRKEQQKQQKMFEHSQSFDIEKFEIETNKINETNETNETAVSKPVKPYNPFAGIFK